jgi:hypothetical protein
MLNYERLVLFIILMEEQQKPWNIQERTLLRLNRDKVEQTLFTNVKLLSKKQDKVYIG